MHEGGHATSLGCTQMKAQVWSVNIEVEWEVFGLLWNSEPPVEGVVEWYWEAPLCALEGGEEAMYPTSSVRGYECTQYLAVCGKQECIQ